jgi:hypothetical protein
MHTSLVFIGLAVLLAASSCRSTSHLPPQSAQHPQAQALERAWRHSQEEDQGAVQVYRPATYAFPPARGRTGYTFGSGGQLMQLDIAPTDGSLPVAGRWRWDNAHVLHLTLAGPPAQDYRLEVVELTNDVLKVSRIEPR